MMAEAYPRVKEIFQQDLASALIYSNSNAVDWGVPDISKYLGEYVRGSNGKSAESRVKVMKLIWDALGTEFGSRHELYERNYAGSYELTRLDTYVAAVATGLTGEFTDFVETCLAEYDTNGWTVPDLINPDDVSVMPKRKNTDR
jgi:4-hydroxyphenylacetate 3-monooxygenase